MNTVKTITALAIIVVSFSLSGCAGYSIVHTEQSSKTGYKCHSSPEWSKICAEQSAEARKKLAEEIDS